MFEWKKKNIMFEFLIKAAEARGSRHLTASSREALISEKLDYLSQQCLFLASTIPKAEWIKVALLELTTENQPSMFQNIIEDITLH